MTVDEVLVWSWWVPVWFRWASVAVAVLWAVFVVVETDFDPVGWLNALWMLFVVPVGLTAVWLVAAFALQVMFL